jgi:ribosomal protein RSM22 (predicted rRNA methylase)
MLTARRVPRACQSCRLKLLSLFEHGFAPSSSSRLSGGLKPSSGPLNRHYPAVRAAYGRRTTRQLSTSAWLQEQTDIRERDTAVENKVGESIEDVVRHARQTFGETLPRDFLSAEEYILYERLYGPPVRETRGEDIELSSGEGGEAVTEADEARVMNVLMRKNEQGEFEEVEFDPVSEGWGFRVVEEVEESLETPESVGVEIGSNANSTDIKPLEDVPLEEIQAWDAEGLMADRAHKDVQVHARTQREIDAILRLRRDMDAIEAQQAREEVAIDEEYEEEEGEEEDDISEEEEPDAYLGGELWRAHPQTILCRFGTSPSTIYLPKERLVLPITELLERTNKKHLSNAAERAFGGPGLPYSTSTPESKKLLQQKHIGLDPVQHKMSEIEADAYMGAVMPGVYASVMSTLVETRKRLGSSWIRDLFFRSGGEGPRVLDAGGGGAGIIAWREMLQAEWDILRGEGVVKPESASCGKSTVLTGPLTLRHRVSSLLQNTTFLPRLPDYVHSANPEVLIDGAAAQGRKTFDVIIAPHMLFPLKEEFRRKNMVENLWKMLDPNGGVLILIEKGLPRGFEAIAGARAHLLKYHISSPSSTHITVPLESPGEQLVEKETGMIIAPCTNHTQCPMYKIEGLSSGRKDFCHFGQRFIRPGFLQDILGASARNHEDVKFSYLAVRRGVDLRSPTTTIQGDLATEAAFAGHEDLPSDETDGQTVPGVGLENLNSIPFSALSLPRIILPPLKGRGHVTLDLCTPSGTLERWVVPKSFSRQAYRDARKSRHGDLWALGAKTRVVREARIGRILEEGKDGNVKKGKLIKDKKKKRKKDVFEVGVGDSGVGEVRELLGRRVDRDAKRTRGGRLQRPKREITDEDDDDWEDEDEDEGDFRR